MSLSTPRCCADAPWARSSGLVVRRCNPDLRHTFGSLAINHASIVQVQSGMGHADVKTTMRCLHHRSRADEAQVLSQAFRTGDW